MTAPNFGDIIKMPAGGFEALPDADVPYWVEAEEGNFVRRRLLFGYGVVKVSHSTARFPKMDATNGRFVFDAPPIPGALMSQIVHFFRRIYDKQKTEATVLLTMHAETKEWGVYIPTQLVSHGGVNYVYDPSTIKGNRLVVGSIHSHCDFSPFHSGTDTGDAADFDGFHATVGYIMRDKPGIVAMVAMNKANMHYTENQFPSLFDYSQLWTKEAPAWWDQYVGPATGSDKPVGFDLYKKFEKPTIIKSHSIPTTPKSSSTTTWQRPTTPVMARGQHGLRAIPGGRSDVSRSDAELARQMASDWGIPSWGGSENYRSPYGTRPWWWGKTPAELQSQGYAWDMNLKTYVWVGSEARNQILSESEAFNARKEAERGVRWGEDGTLRTRMLDHDESKALLRELAGDDKYWEDLLVAAGHSDLRDAILECDSVTEEDFEQAMENPEEASDPSFWKDMFFTKTLGLVEVLRDMGLDIQIKLRTGSPDNDGPAQIEWLLPEDTTTPTTTEAPTDGVH